MSKLNAHHFYSSPISKRFFFISQQNMSKTITNQNAFRASRLTPLVFFSAIFISSSHNSSFETFPSISDENLLNMANPPTKSSDKEAHSSSSARNIKLPKPPFSSPTKGKTVKRIKKEQSQKAPHMIQYQRIGDKRNSYIIYVLRPNKDGGYIHPVQTIVTAETEQGDEFRTYTNARAPLVSRRISRENNSPMLEKSPQNAKQGENNYPFRCLYCEKQDEIPHEDYITYVMGLVKNIINNSSKYKTEFVTDVRLSDATIDGDRPFDHVITDKGIQTILYRYYFMDHLDETTYDEEKKIYHISEDITKTFFKNHQDVAHYIFSPYNGAYSKMAQSFGYPENAEG